VKAKKHSRLWYIRESWINLRTALNPFNIHCEGCDRIFSKRDLLKVGLVNGRKVKVCFPCVISLNSRGLVESGLPGLDVSRELNIIRREY
jgi:hypothetical protein